MFMDNIFKWEQNLHRCRIIGLHRISNHKPRGPSLFCIFPFFSTRLVALAIQPKETSGKRFSQLKLSFVVAVVVAVFVMIFCAIEAPRICQLFRATLAYKLQLSGVTDNCNCFVIVFILPKKHWTWRSTISKRRPNVSWGKIFFYPVA